MSEIDRSPLSLAASRLAAMMAAAPAEVRDAALACLTPGTLSRALAANRHAPLQLGASAKIAAQLLAERERQIEQEGHSRAEDDRYGRSELLHAAVALLFSALGNADATLPGLRPRYATAAGSWWPTALGDFRPKEPRRNLVGAGALIIAEIERLDRLWGKSG